MAGRLPDESDLWAAFQAGPDGARLASQWFDALIGGLPSRPLTEIWSTDGVTSITPRGRNRVPTPVVIGAPSRPRARKLSATDPERYGWRFWGLRPDGVLVAPFTGTVVASGTFDARCARGNPAAEDCTCGVHYALDAGELVAYAHASIQVAEYATLQRMRDNSWSFVLTYGVAIGAVEVDRTKGVPPGRRARRWHILASMTPGLDPTRQAQLEQRYGCEVFPDVSYRACRAVADRLVSSVTPERTGSGNCDPDGREPSGICVRWCWP